MSEFTTTLSADGNEAYRQVVDYYAVQTAPEFSLAATGIEIEQILQIIGETDSDKLLVNPRLTERLDELRIGCPYINKVCRVFASWQGIARSIEDKASTCLHLDEEFVALPQRFDVLPIKRDGVPVLAPIMVSKTTIDNELGHPEVQLLLTPLDEGALALFTPILN